MRDLSGTLKRRMHLIFVALFLLAMPFLVLTFCGNAAHEQYAAGVLTMDECLSCHSGAVEKSITICLGNECLFKKNHSMMAQYPPPGKEMDYAPRSVIENAGSILENGKTTCLSCHDLTKPPPHLIRPGDDLCRICHINR